MNGLGNRARIHLGAWGWALAGIFLVGCGDSPRLGSSSGGSAAPQDLYESRRTALVRAVERAAPSVVGVFTLSPRRMAGEPDESIWRFFPEIPRFREQWVPQLGSGIVLDSKGYFLTNDHLVGGAQHLWVILSDGRQLKAEVVGTDPSYDLAVIRIQGQVNQVFDTAPIGDSNDLMVGEWVVALGNPFGLYLEDPRPSVTAGVVSALHREIKITEGSAVYKDMIQTDAAINPGNSGGPLVNANGEVVGMSTFVFTQGGRGSLGMGFAIPINRVLEVAEELIIYGKVRGVWIGISVQQLSPPIADQLGVPYRNGLVVWSLERGSPADRAGIQLGDIILAVDGRPVHDAMEAKRSIFGARVGDTITFDIERYGEQARVPVTLEAIPTGRGN
jgi:serine protease Do